MMNSEVFEKMKAVFETVAEEAKCNFCQEIIWNSPIFESSGGITACETCKNSSQENLSQGKFYRIFKIERALRAFKTDCKYKIHGCDFDGGPHNIILHEEDCKFRMVLCPINWSCQENFQFLKLFEHFKSKHQNLYILYNRVFDIVYESVFCQSFSITNQMFEKKRHRYHLSTKPFICNSNFIIQICLCLETNIALIWVRLLESKHQAKFINYKIEVKDSVNKVSFEGPVRNIDEKIDDIVVSQNGLSITFANIIKCLKEQRLHFSIVLRNLKPKEDLMVFESGNYESKDPLKKKIKIENTE